MHIKRTLEFALGVLIVIFLLANYSNINGSRSFIDYAIPYEPLQVIAIITLVIIASRLIAGKPKDYSHFFYKIFNTLFSKGDRKL